MNFFGLSRNSLPAVADTTLCYGQYDHSEQLVFFKDTWIKTISAIKRLKAWKSLFIQRARKPVFKKANQFFSSKCKIKLGIVIPMVETDRIYLSVNA